MNELRTHAVAIGTLAAALGGGYLLARIALGITRRVTRHTETIIDDTFIRHLNHPAQAFISLLLLNLVLPQVKIPATAHGLLTHVLGIALIIVVAWVLVGFAAAFRDALLSRYAIDVADNLKARAVHTQLNVLMKIVVVVIVIVAGGSVLMTFEKVRQVGVSILASAGIAGVVIGFAAQRSIATVFAGFQIALTQPIRLEDVVIVEGEWGWIEEIALTFVVVRIWDLRRLVLPITYFIERPFQNWTRVTADILGTVFLYTDYAVPLDALRAELRRIVEASGLWDGKVCGVQVTDSTERTMEVRALVSATDASKAWNLRCLVREQLIGWLQKNHPESLPRLRAEVLPAGRHGIAEVSASS